MLALVFVQALDLHVEHRLRRDLYAALFPYYRRHALFVFELHAHELALEIPVFGVVFEGADRVEVFRPADPRNFRVY